MSDLIDRQATARRLLNERKHYDCYRDIGIGLDIARMIVEDYCPTVQQNTPTDTPTDIISRQAAIDNLLSINEVVPKNKLIDKNDAFKMLVRLPSAQPERKKGRWIEKEDDVYHGGGYTECSVCGQRYSWSGYFEANGFRYCPRCGHRMEVVE